MEMSLWTLLLLLLSFVSRGNTGECPKPVLEGNVVLSDSALFENNFPDGSVVSLKCATGYKVDEGSSTITCLGGEWSHQELTCKKKDCGPPKPSPNMKFNIPSGTLFGDYVRPYCDRGYYLQGSQSRQCLAFGWTGRSKCLLVTCGKPPEIPNSVIVTDHKKEIMEFEDVIEYRCEDGYTLVGSGSVVCQENGKYSSLLECKDECPKPVLEGNVVLSDSALLKNNFPDGSVVSLKCATGYKVDEGSSTITCVGGEWSHQELTCKKKDCGPPTPSPNMKFNIPSGTLFGDYVRPYCDRGYYLQGSSYKQCLAFGWTGRSKCLLVTCGKPPEIPNSVIVTDHKKEIMEFEDVIEYRCEDGYTLVGSGSVVCQENGKYSSLPQCKGECPKPVLEGNVVLSDSALLKNNFPDGSVVSLKCATGYKVDEGSSTITCLGGEWSHQELTCKVVTCGKPPEIPNSVIVTDHKKEIMEFEDVIEYRCEDGYTLVGNGSVVCHENGNYSSLLQCKGECPKPVLEGNVVLSGSALLENNFPDGSVVILKCATGYKVDEGSSTITCLDGEWSHQELTCKVVTCGKPPEIPNSVIVTDHKKEIMEFEDVIEYRCEDGYTLVGNGSVVCQENGKYSSLPQCEVVTCGKPPEIPNSVIVTDHKKEIMEFEDVIEYRCEDGYTLVGSRSVVCQENGKYSSLLQCKDECPKPVLEGNVVLSDSALLKNNFPDGSVVILKCATGYKVDEGSSTITCLDGEWSHQELTCKVVTCGKPPEIPNSVIVTDHKKEIMEFEDVIEYRCEDGYTLVGNGSVVCQENGNYSSLLQCEGTYAVLISALVIGIAVLGCTGICLFFKCLKKRKGSYNTGEEKMPKDALMQRQSFIYY
ncbi:sushi, von Willebrand factor type A, EGF and pentraxin domain-containing protein 1 isoform X2 [Hemibagrus wyckioides]|uniref:sushi, von Willebrand factor type A, EGF and pentraxin domain-containing protein 1 isoform X2 n=1 Tax=Hemibagrus wyckioides TaxID=337641 RepID=UPI00266B7E97|nr:sushi, von Willebrand factor type A, EGF and pentraxin domain-containing protein 1 isoform X2 [Hemibagrus wyckioides]